MSALVKAGVMGWPVGHSLSPRLHNYWLKKYGIAGSYETMPVEPQNLTQALRDLQTKGFRGVNLTIPHKESALKVMDKVDPLATRIGAMNTVVVRTDGALEGFNTDVFGFIENLRAGGIDMKNKPAIVLGAGGAARAVVVALQEMGASEIRLVNRTIARAETLAKSLGAPAKVLAWQDVGRSMKDGALLVNATSLGMQGQPPLDVALDALPIEAVVTDLVYTPLVTDLLQRARKRGNRVIDGLGMLLHQARPAFKAFFGKDPDVTEDLRRYVLEQK